MRSPPGTGSGRTRSGCGTAAARCCCSTAATATSPSAVPRVVTLGPDLAAGQAPQHVVPGGHWQSARPRGGRRGPGELRGGARLRLRRLHPAPRLTRRRRRRHPSLNSWNTVRPRREVRKDIRTGQRSPERLEELAAMTTSRSRTTGDWPGTRARADAALRRRDRATVWVETDRECQVEILGRTAPTFEVAGHHYGLVVHRRPGARQRARSTRSRSTASVRWPLPDGEFPPSVLRTLEPGPAGPARVRLLPGRRDRAAEPGQARPGAAARNRPRTGVDALAACGRRAARTLRVTAGPTCC